MRFNVIKLDCEVKMKKLLFLCLLVLMGCSQKTSNTSLEQESVSTSFESSLISEINSDIESSLTTNKSSISSSNTHETSSKFTTSVTSDKATSESYNPDGSKTLPIPSKSVSTWGQEETIYDFKESFPEEFSYIYGHQILKNPAFYSAGGWKITVPNSSARIGFQTPIFNTDLKIEIRLYIAGIYNSNNKVDEKTPFITIYGFNETGKLIRTLEVENLKNFYNYKDSKNPLQIYLNGEGLSYFELRFTAAPYKSSQCYNFGINQIGFKTFPYPIEN